MKTLIRAVSRRFGTLPKLQRALLVGVLLVFVLYGGMDCGRAVGRALHYLAH